MDQIGPMSTEYNQSRQNGPNMNEVDKIGPMWTK